jgi:hypothetical protein
MTRLSLILIVLGFVAGALLTYWAVDPSSIYHSCEVRF